MICRKKQKKTSSTSSKPKNLSVYLNSQKYYTMLYIRYSSLE